MKFYQTTWFCILMLILFFPVGIYLMFQYKHFNNTARIIITIFICLLIIAGLGKNSDTVKSNNDTEVSDAENTEEIDNGLHLDKISVSAEIRDVFKEGKQGVILTIKNDSDYVFDGTVSIKLKDPFDKTVYRDIIFVEKLDPGHQTDGVVWAKPGSVKCEYSASGSFTQFTSIFQESIDNFKNKLSKIDTPQTKNFEIIHTEYTRYDGAPTYYVLIDEVNLDNDNFKEEISNIIIVLLKEYGTKVNINIFDDLETLNFDFEWNKKIRDNTNMSANEIKELQLAKKNKNEQLTRHYILHFIGENEVAFSPYDIYYFPNATNDTPEVGKYVEIKEFTLD